MYVDAFKDKDVIKVVERVDGKRIFKQYPAKYVLYTKNEHGNYKNIFGDNLDRFVTSSSQSFYGRKKSLSGEILFESDTNVTFRCLADNYGGMDAPKFHQAFFDIEVGFCKERGFAPPDDTFNPVTAISVHLDWLGETLCLVNKPPLMSSGEAQDIVAKFNNVLLLDTEEELIDKFLILIENSDVMSGWNSEGYDIPYLVNRTRMLLGNNATRRFCLWDQLPIKKEIEKYGKKNQTYGTVGRLHLDYMNLYQKYTYHEMHSYSLDAIGEHEINERKVAYKGNLDELYNNDFEKFINYGIQDVDILVKLDKKLQFIDITNVLAHDNSILIPTTMGAVGMTDQAIINEAHNRKLIVHDKKLNKVQKHYPHEAVAAGGYVQNPKKGLHEWIGSMDLNSLYPSVIYSLNMSTETIVGQIRHTLTVPMLKEFKWKASEAWADKFACPEYDLVMKKDTDINLIIDFEDGQEISGNGADIYEIIFNSSKPWALSSNGTIIDQSKKGIIPGLLERWYAERKVLQKKARDARDAGDNETYKYWDKRQLVKKISLNSLYGAILNQGSRFFDPRIGQSTTLTGRSIVHHMGAKVNELFTNEYNNTGDSIIYGDTDSVDRDSIISTSVGDVTIEQLFNKGSIYQNEEDSFFIFNDGSLKQYVSYDDLTIKHVNRDLEIVDTKINYVYKHRVSKPRYKITTENGKSIIVTDDHSIMVYENNELIEKKPHELTDKDVVVTVI